MEDQLQDLALPGFQDTAALDPVFGVLYAEAAFRLVADDQIMQLPQTDNVAVIDAHELRGVGEGVPAMLRWKVGAKAFDEFPGLGGHVRLLAFLSRTRRRRAVFIAIGHGFPT